MRGPLALLAAFFDRLGRHESAPVMATYAYDQIDHARTELKAVSK